MVTKFSGCFAFGKKPKASEADLTKPLKSIQKSKKLPSLLHNTEKLAATLLSPSSTPLNLQNIPLVGTTTSPTCPSSTNNNNHDNDLTNTSSNTIPNFDNIYQHLMKQNHTDLQLKREPAQLAQQSPETALSLTPHHNPFFAHQHNLLNNSSTSLTPPTHPSEDILHSPNSHHGSMTPLTQDDHSNGSSVQGPYYGPIRSTLPPGNFI